MEEIKAISQIQLDNQGNKTDLLLQHFTDLIINKTLPPHYVFPNENTMCELLSIGRGTLREVYKVLELKGFITRSKNGTVVNDIKDLARNGVFDISLLLSEEKNVVEFLLITDPAAAKIAANQITDDELEEVFSAMIKLEEANHKGNIQLINEYNALFHQKIREACHNPILVSSINSARKRYEDIIISKLIDLTDRSKEFMDLCLLQHYNLYHALKTHDEQKAYDIMYNHFQTDIDYMKKATDIK